MKKLIIFYFIISSTVFAEISFDCSKEILKETAYTYLKKVQNKYKGLNSFKADFVQKSYLAAMDLTEKSKGEVLFSNPSKMKWNYLLPEKQVFLLSDHTLWLYQPEIEQVYISKLKQMLLSELPVSFLLGVGSLEKEFNLEKACFLKEKIVFSLLPKKKDNLKKLRLMVKDFIPLGAEVTDMGGNITSIVFSNMKTNINLLKSDFSPDFPKNIDWIDQRKTSF